MPKESIKMTQEELRDFLKTDSRLVLATLAPDTKAWADTVAYVFVDDRIYFRVSEHSLSLANIRRDPRVAGAVESHPKGSEYYAIRGATCHGSAKEGSTAQVDAALARIADPVAPRDPRNGVVFSIGIEDQLSFMFSKIKYRYDDRRSA